jgi:histidyl-tRNA synthetase
LGSTFVVHTDNGTMKRMCMIARSLGYYEKKLCMNARSLGYYQEIVRDREIARSLGYYEEIVCDRKITWVL